MCYTFVVWFLGMNVILSPPIHVPCPRKVIAEELLRHMAPPAQKERVIDPFTVQMKEA